jgi:hypothetical protein
MAASRKEHPAVKAVRVALKEHGDLVAEVRGLKGELARANRTSAALAREVSALKAKGKAPAKVAR